MEQAGPGPEPGRSAQDAIPASADENANPQLNLPSVAPTKATPFDHKPYLHHQLQPTRSKNGSIKTTTANLPPRSGRSPATRLQFSRPAHSPVQPLERRADGPTEPQPEQMIEQPTVRLVGEPTDQQTDPHAASTPAGLTPVVAEPASASTTASPAWNSLPTPQPSQEAQQPTQAPLPPLPTYDFATAGTGTPPSGQKVYSASTDKFETPQRTFRAAVYDSPGIPQSSPNVPGGFGRSPASKHVFQDDDGSNGQIDLEAISQMMQNFNFNAILRGAQLTFVGAFRALRNPNLFRMEFYRYALLAVLTGIALKIVVAFPVFMLRLLIWMASFVFDLQNSFWDDSLIEGLEFIERSVLQVPFLLLSLVHTISPTLDRLFMESLEWVDKTYVAKHAGETQTAIRASYFRNLDGYSGSAARPAGQSSGKGQSRQKYLAQIRSFAARHMKRVPLSLGIYFASFLPVVGPLVLPAASFLTFRKEVGTVPALAIFAVGTVLPKSYLVAFLQTYYSSRSVVRQLLEPYFRRIHFTKKQKSLWYRDRSGVLFGFGLTFYFILKLPLIGVLVYGIAEASTAYLLTKITDPPPANPYLPENRSPASATAFSSAIPSLLPRPQNEPDGKVETAALDRYILDSLKWTNKKQFLETPVLRLDEIKRSFGSSVSSARSARIPPPPSPARSAGLADPARAEWSPAAANQPFSLSQPLRGSRPGGLFGEHAQEPYGFSESAGAAKRQPPPPISNIQSRVQGGDESGPQTSRSQLSAMGMGASISGAGPDQLVQSATKSYS